MLKEIQQKIHRKIRDNYSELVYRIDVGKYANKLPKLSSGDRAIVEEMKREGVAITSLEKIAIPSNTLLQEAAKHLLPDLEIKESTIAPSKNKRHAFSHSIPVNAIKIAKEYPELFLWGLEERILNIMEGYVGMPVAYHGVNMRRDIVNEEQIGTRYWHLDGEDRTVIKIIIYLNDVDENGGPFEYIPKSLTPSYHLFKKVNYTITNEEMDRIIPVSKWKRCTGSAGTVIFVDTGKVFHHGKVPLAERTAIFFAYTSRKPKRPELCQSSSFREALPFLQSNLSKRQKETIWQYQELVSQK